MVGKGGEVFKSLRFSHGGVSRRKKKKRHHSIKRGDAEKKNRQRKGNVNV